MAKFFEGSTIMDFVCLIGVIVMMFAAVFIMQSFPIYH